MPYYFYNNQNDAGYPDNKHAFVQLSFEALEYVEITVAIELLSGKYFVDFDLNVIDIGDVFVHAPSRAEYTPSTTTRAAFLAIISTDLFTPLTLPLNLPMEFVRNPGAAVGFGAGTYTVNFEHRVLIGRTSDLAQADPMYQSRFEERMRQNYIAYTTEFEKSNASARSGQNMTTFAEFANIPNLNTISSQLYAVPDPLSNVYVDVNTFWGFPEVVNGFIGLPYFPYFSNCKGSDSYISIAKTLETDPSCPLVVYEKTVPVSSFPWDGSTKPYADECLVPTPVNEMTRKVGNATITWLPDTRGALFECVFEEGIDIPPVPATFRWYEAALGTTLFYMTNIPIHPADYTAAFTTDTFGTETYSTYWGQGDIIVNMMGDPSKALPISVGDISGSYGGGLEMVVPRQVRLQLRYYQVDKGTKRLVNGNIIYPSDYQCHTLTGGSLQQQSLETGGIPQCVTDINGRIATKEYQLEVEFYPLGWYALLNAFQFTPPIYILFFLFTGLITIIAALMVYVLNRLLTRLRYPPQFHGLPLLYAITVPAVFGCCLGAGSTFVAGKYNVRNSHCCCS
jgi:hypothetical protein